MTQFEQNILYATWASVFVGACGVAAAFYAALRSTKIARAGLTHAAKTTEHELRAYVFLQETQIEMRELSYAGDPSAVMRGSRMATGRVSYQYVNSGKTPAKSVRVAARALWRPAGALIDGSDVGQLRDVGPLGPGDQLDEQLEIEGAPHSSEIRRMVEQAACEVHLIGRIRYSDEWSTDRETSFHYYVGADAGWDESMTAATTGNTYK